MDLIAAAIFDAAGLLVFHRGEDAQVVEFVSNPLIAHTADLPREDVPHYSGRFFVNEQVVFVLRVFEIAVRRKRTNKLSVTASNIQMAADFDGRIPAIIIVH